MAHRKKHRSDKSATRKVAISDETATKKVAMKARSRWRFGAIALGGVIVLIAASYWLPRPSVKPLPTTPVRPSDMAVEKAPPSAPLGSKETFSTNDAESVDVDKATDL